MIKLNRNGDTLVEVMLSMAVIAMVIGASYAISNRATQLGRLAQQRTQINNLMRTQAEYLKNLRNNSSPQWTTALGYGIAGTPSSVVDCATTSSSANRFYVNDSGAVINGTESQNNGLYNTWVLPYQGSGYTDFYILGCWQGPGAYGQQQSFIVERLNNSL